jgi:hypothetical protein
VGAAGLGDILARTGPVLAADSAATLPAMTDRPSIGPISLSAKSLVVHLRRDEVIDGPKIHQPLLSEMIEEGLRIVTGAVRTADAWRTLLKPDDVIAIKLNQVGFTELGTSEVFAGALVNSLGEAGFAPDRIILIEAPRRLERELKTRPRPFGWSGGPISFGSGTDELAAVLQEVTAIINVPFLKTHNIAGMTGCLKNLSHALVRHPGRYHAQACSPFVGDIVALPQIRDKLRLNIVNALRAVYKGGPAVGPESTWAHAGLLLSTDPVATDAVGIEILNEQRAKVSLGPVSDTAGQVPHVHAAAQRGVGTDDQDYIQLLQQ